MRLRFSTLVLAALLVPRLALADQGHLLLDFERKDNAVYELLPTGDQGFYAFGLTGTGLAVSRHQGDGSLVASFGSGGQLSSTALSGSLGQVLLADGGFAACGTGFVLARYDAVGAQKALSAAAVPGGSSACKTLLAQPDGKFLLLGSSGSSSRVVRLNAGGSKDAGFASGGIASAEIGVIHDGLLLADGSVLALSSGSLLKLGANGQADATFGRAGVVTLPATAGGLTLLAQGERILVLTVANDGSAELRLLRYQADGSLDAGFGNAGVLSTSLYDSSDAFLQFRALQPDGKGGYYLLGRDSPFSPRNLGVRHFSAEGVADQSFGDQGLALMPSTGVLANQRALALAVDSRGGLLVGGGARNQSEDFVIYRLSSAGQIDTAFGASLPDPDTSADAFDFSDVVDAVAGSLVMSNVVTVSGINQPAEVFSQNQAQGASLQPEVSINGGEWVSGRVFPRRTVSNGDRMQLRVTAPSAKTSIQMSAFIGSTFDLWNVTSGDGSTPPADTTPDAFGFAPVSNAALDSLVESETVTISGINTTVPVTAQDLEYSLNGGAYTAAAGQLQSGDRLRVRLRSAATPATGRSGRLIVDSAESADLIAEFSVTTAEPPPADTTPDPISFAPRTGVEPGALVESEVVSISGINAATAIGVQSGEFRINGGDYRSEAASVQSGDTVQLRHTASLMFNASVSTLLTVGEVATSFTSTTRAQQPPPTDTTPDAFQFLPQNDAAAGALVVSNRITVSGINAPAAISVTGGEYQIGDAAFTSAAGQISNGETVQLRLTAAAAGGSAEAVLNIGGVSASFTVSSAAEPPPSGGSQAQVMDSSNRSVRVETDRGQLRNVRSLAPAPDAPGNLRFRNGMFAFDIENLAAGELVRVTLRLPAGSAPNHYYKFGPETGLPIDHYYRFDFDAATGTGARIEGDTVTLFLRDNGRGDHDPTPGRIADPGAPVFETTAVSAEASGGGALGLWSLLLALPALRRRQPRG